MVPSGFPLWDSHVEPGSVHDLTAAREHVLSALYRAASQLDLPTLADNGYDGAGIGVFTPGQTALCLPKTSSMQVTGDSRRQCAGAVVIMPQQTSTA